MGPDDYVLAAVTLYLDIVNLFLYLLEILRMLQAATTTAGGRVQSRWPRAAVTSWGKTV